MTAAAQLPADDDTIVLVAGDARATVRRRGAELCRWCNGGQDRLWHGDPAVWPRHSPLLFPLVGRLQDGVARFGARSVPMPVHGFAATEEFEVVGRTADRVALVLRATAATRALYPFDFGLTVHVHLRNDGIDLELEVANEGSQTMPYSIGLHPGFPWQHDPAAPHRVDFDADERPLVPVITPGGLFTSQLRPVPLRARSLALQPALLAEEALCFLDAASRSLRWVAPDGSAVVLQAEGFRHWALWSPPGGRVVCIEAWTGHGDQAGATGAFADRPSTLQLAAGGTQRHALRLRYRGTSA